MLRLNCLVEYIFLLSTLCPTPLNFRDGGRKQLTHDPQKTILWPLAYYICVLKHEKKKFQKKKKILKMCKIFNYFIIWPILQCIMMADYKDNFHLLFRDFKNKLPTNIYLLFPLSNLLQKLTSSRFPLIKKSILTNLCLIPFFILTLSIIINYYHYILISISSKLVSILNYLSSTIRPNCIFQQIKSDQTKAYYLPLFSTIS